MPPLPASKASVKFLGMDAMRFYAAFSIVFYHATIPLVDFWPPPLKVLVHNLSVGVDFFFLISGFLITYLLLAEKSTTGTISLGAFYLRRALRIFPLYYFIIGLAYYVYRDTHPEINFSKYLYFWGNFWMIETDKWTVSLLIQLWSLCIEEHFYLVIPMLVLLLPTRWLGGLFGGIILLSVAFRYHATSSLFSNWMTIYAHTLSRCDVLALGGLLAWQHHRRPIRWHLPNWLFYVALALVAMLLSVMNISEVSTLYSATVLKYLYVLPITFLFCFVVFNDARLITPAIMHPINYLGKISYGLYMYHGIVIEKHYEIPFMATHTKWRLFSMFLVTVLVSIVSYELFEKQILRLKSRFERVRTARA